MQKKADQFLQSLKDIKWYDQLGKPIEDSSALQMKDWSEWEGPESENVLRLHDEHQDIFEAFISPDEDLDEAFLYIMVKVQERAAKDIGIPLKEEMTHAPTIATWQAGFTSGLIFALKYQNVDPPEFLLKQWKHLQNGHWPGGYQGEELIVF